MRCFNIGTTLAHLGITAMVLLAPAPATAQEPGPTGTGAFLFAYQPEPGQEAAFEEGYRAHLAWHREHQDSLSWLGWSVLAGPRLGAFVDGVFGIDYAALDARVDPAGDAAHMAANVTPHATPLTRHLLRARPDLSTAFPAEDGAPTPLVEVTRYTVAPGRVSLMEDALGGLRRDAEAGSLHPYTVYELGAGARPGFLLMTWRTRLASFDATARDPVPVLRRHLVETAEAAGVADGLVDGVASEVWQFRPDLTYVPEEQ